MPSRKLRGNWCDRVVAVLRAAAEIKRSPVYGAAKIGERDEKIVDMATREAERVELEMIRAEPMVSDPFRFSKAVAIAADQLERRGAADAQVEAEDGVA